MADGSTIYEQKLRFMAEAERKLRRKLTQAERKLLAEVFANVLDQFAASEPGGGLRNASNLRVVDGLTAVFKEFTSKEVLPMVKEYGRVVEKMLDFTDGYFRAELPGQPRLTKALASGKDYLRSKVGITPGGGLKRGGYLSEFLTDQTVRNGVRREIYRAIDNGGDIRAVKKAVTDYVRGKGKGDGVLTKHFDTFLFDTLQEGDAAVNNQVRTEVGLQAAVYRGGLIETTRKKCCELNGLTWTEWEIEELSKGEWSGKKGDLLIFRGGWNCRHQWRWISNERAARVRPDLMVDPKTGKLVKRDPGSPQQEVHEGCEEPKKRRQSKRKAASSKGRSVTPRRQSTGGGGSGSSSKVVLRTRRKRSS